MSAHQAAVPQVVVRGYAMLLVDPEIADVQVAVRVRARDRQTALERCAARQDQVGAVVAAAGDAVVRARQYAAAFGARLTALLEVRDVGPADGGLRVAGAMASMARFEGEPHLDLVPAPQEVHGTVEVRFTMSEPDQEVFRA